MEETASPQHCPCGTGAAYADCCARIHAQGAGLGRTAEQLMRARYAAYVLGDADFLLASWHSDTRPDSLTIDADVVWDGLEIVTTAQGGAFDNVGIVEFRARFRRGGEPLELHERSSFERVDSRWVYVDGS